jgi:rare lipoprotein A
VLLLLAGLAGCATATPPPAQLPAPPPQAALQPPEQIPAVTPYFAQTGLASFYGAALDGNLTAGGQIFDHREFTAAHRTLALGTVVRVTNLDNGETVNVKVTDRGPTVKTRIIDLSSAAANALEMKKKGVVRVKIEAFGADQTG